MHIADETKVSILTSIYKGDDYIIPFMENIVKQTAFPYCELILMDCNSPDNEKKLVQEYLDKFDNIKYIEYDEDPGIYGAWNRGIEMAQGEYVTNANLDDKRHPQQIDKLTRILDLNPSRDLIYAYSAMSTVKNESFEELINRTGGHVKAYPTTEFSKENMIKCLPGCQPIWRKSMHNEAGMFDEDYKYAGDWEMWLRAVRNGSKFMFIPEVLGLYYDNPEGLSTSEKFQSERFKEEADIFFEYKDLFGEENYNKFHDYFVKAKNE